VESGQEEEIRQVFEVWRDVRQGQDVRGGVWDIAVIRFDSTISVRLTEGKCRTCPGPTALVVAARWPANLPVTSIRPSVTMDPFEAAGDTPADLPSSFEGTAHKCAAILSQCPLLTIPE
jgi:hypothetical protein